MSSSLPVVLLTGVGMPTRESQEMVHPQSHEPSPTPASRTRTGNTQVYEKDSAIENLETITSITFRDACEATNYRQPY